MKKPFCFTKQLTSGSLQIQKEDVEAHLKKVQSDSKRNKPLPHNPKLTDRPEARQPCI